MLSNARVIVAPKCNSQKTTSLRISTGSVGNDSLEFESRVELRVTDVESRLEVYSFCSKDSNQIFTNT